MCIVGVKKKDEKVPSYFRMETMIFSLSSLPFVQKVMHRLLKAVALFIEENENVYGGIAKTG